jgi:UDP-N-acetylglucosamine--N-acetylmuramyl-(pentapeptide) pyrophosphoryl-undecaprenol N-acetylglucosamine transferase
MNSLRVIIAGGGTGGHVFPGIAVADALARRSPDLQVCWVGTTRGIEARVLPTTPWRFEPMDISPLNGVRGIKLIKALGKLPSAAMRAVSLIRSFRPHVVLGVGGYAGGPVVALAAALRVPVAVLEPNAILGLTNRMLARVVKRAFLTHEQSTKDFPKGISLVTGSPVRRAFLQRMAAELKINDVAEVLVVGGSQGAKAINEVFPETLKQLRDRGIHISLTHQTGASARDEVIAAYKALNVEANVVSFIDDIAEAMERASLVVCRAGAMTVAELGVIGRPAIYIPLPTAADDHQRKNAESMSAIGAARCVLQQDLTPERLANEMASVLSSPDTLRTMAMRAWETARPDAAGVIADELIALATL